MTIERRTVDHVARLASLSLTDEEGSRITRELDAILAYVEELRELDTSNVEATASVQLGPTAWRADVVEDGLAHDAALAGAPRVAEGCFAVPAFVEGGSREGGR
jgi:aspartyl-tRNA(Asn)/glutamyl-tRNA(Gln) amidotransferase subunit C